MDFVFIAIYEKCIKIACKLKFVTHHLTHCKSTPQLFELRDYSTHRIIITYLLWIFTKLEHRLINIIKEESKLKLINPQRK